MFSRRTNWKLASNRFTLAYQEMLDAGVKPPPTKPTAAARSDKPDPEAAGGAGEKPVAGRAHAKGGEKPAPQSEAEAEIPAICSMNWSKE